MPTPPSSRKSSVRALLGLVAMGWALGLILTAMAFGLYLGQTSGESMAAARPWVQRWPAPLNQLPVGAPSDCGVGPSTGCAMVAVPLPEGGDDVVRIWPKENWAKAWLPLSAWRVAHSIATHAAESAYGQQVLIAGPQGMPSTPVPAEGRYRPASGHPSWRLSMIVPPDFMGQVTDRMVEQGPAPSVSTTGDGPVVRFADGLVLPARQENGDDGWTVLAQGPMAQAVRMAAALMGRPDVAPSEAPLGSQVLPSDPAYAPLNGPNGRWAGTSSLAPEASTSPVMADTHGVLPGTSGSLAVPLDPLSLLAEPRPDRDDDLRSEARDGLRTERPVLGSPDPALDPAEPPAVQAGNDPDDGRTRDRDRLRALPHGHRPMIVDDLPDSD